MKIIFNWKRLSVIFAIIFLTVGATAGSVWAGYTGIINNQKEEINSLQAQADSLSEQIKIRTEKEAQTAVEAAAQAKTKAEAEAQAKAVAEAQAAAEAVKKKSKSSTTNNTLVPEVSNSQILYFYNPVCGSCVAQEPILRQLEGEGVRFAWMNVVDYPEYTSQYGIQYTPTFLLNGNRLEGYQEKTTISNYWNNYK